MNVEQDTLRRLVTRDLTETLIRVALIALLMLVCVRVFWPFSHLVLFSAILAIALYPLFARMARAFGGRQGLAATVLVVLTLVLIGVPLVLLGGQVAEQLSNLYHAVEADTLAVQPPSPRVAEWPIVGERLYVAWNEAAANLPAFLAEHRALIRGWARKALGMAAGGAAATGLFLVAVIVAGVMMAFAETQRRAAERILVRLTDAERGPRLQRLSIATIRSVATGVVGVAVIQAALLGVGFLLAGIPAAGVLALLVMFLGILQLPAVILSIPAIAYLWMADTGMSTVMKVVFTVWFVVGGLADNVLKPLLLGRGVDVPMLVVLIGAIGGMVAGGITGLFLGAVLLAVGYQLFMEWVGGDPSVPPPPGPSLPLA